MYMSFTNEKLPESSIDELELVAILRAEHVALGLEARARDVELVEELAVVLGGPQRLEPHLVAELDLQLVQLVGALEDEAVVVGRRDRRLFFFGSATTTGTIGAASSGGGVGAFGSSFGVRRAASARLRPAGRLLVRWLARRDPRRREQEGCDYDFAHG